MNIIVDTFEWRVFESNDRPNIDVNYDLNDAQELDLPAAFDSDIDKSYGLTDKEIQIFKKLLSYKNPEKLEQAIMRAETKEKYSEFLNDLNIEKNILKEEIRTQLVFHAQD